MRASERQFQYIAGVMQVGRHAGEQRQRQSARAPPGGEQHNGDGEKKCGEFHCPSRNRSSVLSLSPDDPQGASWASPVLAPLFVPHVAAEVVVDADVGGIALDANRAVAAGRKDLLQEGALIGPGPLRLSAAVAPRHGVVEPAMRRVAVNMNVVAFSVTLQAIAKAPDIVDRD